MKTACSVPVILKLTTLPVLPNEKAVDWFQRQYPEPEQPLTPVSKSGDIVSTVGASRRSGPVV